MKLKKVLGVLAVVLVVYFIITQPGPAKATAANIGSTLKNAADSVISFFSGITA